jgi:N-acetyl-anhydromuramyl-L-alanine amidase AmpD
MSTGWYPGAYRLPITTNEYFPARAVPLVGIVEHITDGTDSRDWLQHAQNGSSVHFLIREERGLGVVYQFMPVEWAAWGNGRYSQNNPYMPGWVRNLVGSSININHATVSIEHERDWPFSTPLRGPMLDASIELHRWLVANYPTIKPDREHLIGHYQIDHVDRANCPGGPEGRLFPFDTIISAVVAPQPVTFPETGVTVAPDFYAYWQQNGGLPIFGYPIKGERVMLGQDGQTIPFQSFERARFERHADGIKLGLVEVERLRLMGQL